MGGGMRLRLHSRHRLQEPESEVDRASDEEVVAMFLACRSAGDRLTLLLPARVGLRPGQVADLHRCDAHLMPDSRSLGCDVEGAHVHVVRRQNENGAWSKSKKAWAMPVDFLVVQAFDLYAVERHEWLGSGGSDHCLVNLFRPPCGAPITTGAIGELLESPSRRAGLGRVRHTADVPARNGQQRHRRRWVPGRGAGAAGSEAPRLSPPVSASCHGPVACGR